MRRDERPRHPMGTRGRAFICTWPDSMQWLFGKSRNRSYRMQLPGSEPRGANRGPQQRLPLTIGQFHLRNEESRILADTGYSPVQLHVEMKDVEMIFQLRDSKCWDEAQNISGCYRCQTGAQFCTIFAASCSTNQSAQREVLNFDQSRINTKCSVDCPAGITYFVLEGELYYVPIKHRSNFRHRQSDRLDSGEGNWFDLNFDPWALSRLFFNPWALLVFAVVLVVGNVALALC
uniref:Uncharacterized protein n=1 Tax=Globodera rostochiensis TaxID=31243 RepID=A0A914IHN5_GLORO